MHDGPLIIPQIMSPQLPDSAFAYPPTRELTADHDPIGYHEFCAACRSFSFVAADRRLKTWRFGRGLGGQGQQRPGPHPQPGWTVAADRSTAGPVVRARTGQRRPGMRRGTRRR
jgi:hypothetical protein